MPRRESTIEELMAYAEAEFGGDDLSQACVRIAHEQEERWMDAVIRGAHGKLPAEPVAAEDLRLFEGRLEKRDADGIWRPLQD